MLNLIIVQCRRQSLIKNYASYEWSAIKKHSYRIIEHKLFNYAAYL
ncbi:hypothetical protein [Vibrio gallaecicus]|nr:hypothetical protein [Vibrio gallaecicus]MDN3615969.1 hypothetical protein [Vibrio gallaecicus]